MKSQTSKPEITNSLFDVTNRLEDSFRQLKGLMTRMESEASTTTERLKITAEIRLHIALAEKTLAASTRAEAVSHFIEAVFDSVNTLSPTAIRQFTREMSHHNSQLFRRRQQAERQIASHTNSN